MENKKPYNELACLRNNLELVLCIQIQLLKHLDKEAYIFLVSKHKYQQICTYPEIEVRSSRRLDTLYQMFFELLVRILMRNYILFDKAQRF